MATHYTIKSKSPSTPNSPDTWVDLSIYSDNRGKGTQATLHSAMHVIFDAADPEAWDELWLLQNDIRLALDAAQPGTFNPLPDGESDVKP